MPVSAPSNTPQLVEGDVRVRLGAIPCCCCAVSAELLPERNRSSGVSSETSVLSYIWIASPQNNEKFASICVNASPPMGTVPVPFHKLG